MDQFHCPRCKYYSECHKMSLGKELNMRGECVDCHACSGTGYIPSVVMESIRNSFPDKADKILSELKWGGDHFYFNLHDMYIGVEVKDGYIHS